MPCWLLLNEYRAEGGGHGPPSQRSVASFPPSPNSSEAGFARLGRIYRAQVAHPTPRRSAPLSIPAGAIQSLLQAERAIEAEHFQYQQVRFSLRISAETAQALRDFQYQQVRFSPFHSPTSPTPAVYFQYQQVRFSRWAQRRLRPSGRPFNTSRCDSVWPTRWAGASRSTPFNTSRCDSVSARRARTRRPSSLSIPAGAIQSRAISSSTLLPRSFQYQQVRFSRLDKDVIHKRVQRFQYQQVRFSRLVEGGRRLYESTFNTSRCDSVLAARYEAPNDSLSFNTSRCDSVLSVSRAKRLALPSFNTSRCDSVSARRARTRRPSSLSIPAGAIQSPTVLKYNKSAHPVQGRVFSTPWLPRLSSPPGRAKRAGGRRLSASRCGATA